MQGPRHHPTLRRVLICGAAAALIAVAIAVSVAMADILSGPVIGADTAASPVTRAVAADPSPDPSPTDTPTATPTDTPTPTPTDTPTPTPTPTDTPTPTPTPAPTASPSATPSPSPSPIPFTSTIGPPPATVIAPPAPVRKRLRAIRPFPIVRIKGVLTPAGAHVTLFSVLAPRRVHILARCRGSACPRAAWRHTASTRLTRLRPFERDLRAGTRIAVLVRAPDRIGKFSAFVIRRGLAPRRRDSCVMPGGSRSVRCPEALLR